jgi:phage shock protein PspC (stress-responsive transcriptional regulator)
MKPNLAFRVVGVGYFVIGLLVLAYLWVWFIFHRESLYN